MALFLVADTQLYKRLCPSVGPLVRWSVTLELKTQKTRVYNTAVIIVCGCVSAWQEWLGVGLG